MLTNEIILDSLGRVHELVPAVLENLSREDILWQPDIIANSIGWLIWHLTRVEDEQMADLVKEKSVWLRKHFYERFDLPYPKNASGFGMNEADVAKFSVPDAKLLIEYSAAVAEQSRKIVEELSEKDFTKIIDKSWDPPVTIAMRIVSIINDITQHIGQAAYVRGLRERVIGRESGWVGYV